MCTEHPTLKSTVTHLAPIECTWSETSRTSHARTTSACNLHIAEFVSAEWHHLCNVMLGQSMSGIAIALITDSQNETKPGGVGGKGEATEVHWVPHTPMILISAVHHSYWLQISSARSTCQVCLVGCPISVASPRKPIATVSLCRLYVRSC